MRLTNENILIASLLGSKAVEQIPRFAAVQNELSKHVLPPVRFLPLQTQPDEIHTADNYDETELWMNDKPLAKDDQFFPLLFKKASEKQFYLFPWEPMISIEAKTRTARRYVAKAGSMFVGSIKEVWSMDDYDIRITGAFYGDKLRGKSEQTYPIKDMERLRDYLMAGEAIEVRCEPLQILGIHFLTIDSVSFPFTKGENVQAYEIRAWSDSPWSLLYNKQEEKQEKKKWSLTMGEMTQEIDV